MVILPNRFDVNSPLLEPDRHTSPRLMKLSVIDPAVEVNFSGFASVGSGKINGLPVSSAQAFADAARLKASIATSIKFKVLSRFIAHLLLV